ncbi:uncharacterized protein GGS25DRAFT_482131, partial [Hypoxylon fragiforme]|uniref:uncharacterized protein n=1 Tax=Hypoxylon fragiforme TaxID=63214 RepID=UPI0020C689D8
MNTPHLLTLLPRIPIPIPKGGGRGGGSRGGYRGGGGGGGGSGSSGLPWWAILLITCGVLWICGFIYLFCRFVSQSAEQRARQTRGARPSLWKSHLGDPAWRAFKYMTLIQAVTWTCRKLGGVARAQKIAVGEKNAVKKTGKAEGGEEKMKTKKMGGSFYQKLGDEEQGFGAGAGVVGTDDEAGSHMKTTAKPAG